MLELHPWGSEEEDIPVELQDTGRDPPDSWTGDSVDRATGDDLLYQSHVIPGGPQAGRTHGRTNNHSISMEPVFIVDVGCKINFI